MAANTVFGRFDLSGVSGKGVYLLWLRPLTFEPVEIGRLGVMVPQRGFYGYVGSAMGPGGIAARVGRHLRRDKAMRWHLDYLRPACEVVALWYLLTGQRVEHRWAESLAGLPGAVPAMAGFGASDHPGATHLFHFDTLPALDLFADRAGCSGVQSLSLSG